MEAAPFLSLPPGGVAPDHVWWMRAADGVRLRAARWLPDAPLGLAVYLSGRTEFIEKAALPAAELVARGYEVVSLDWRGQGLSDRAADPGLKGHVGDFAEYQHDLDALLASRPVREAAAGPRLMVGHSMGGTIAIAAFLRDDVRDGFDAAVLSAPMFGIAMSAPMRVAAHVTLKVGMALRQGEKWPPFGDVSTPYVLTGDDPNVLTHDRAIWDWLVTVAKEHAALNLGMPTLDWFAAATREMERLSRAAPVRLPVLCLLGTAEKVVDPVAVRATAARLGLELVEIDGARHEHFNEAPGYRAQAWSAIDRFLAAQGLPAG